MGPMSRTPRRAPSATPPARWLSSACITATGRCGGRISAISSSTARWCWIPARSPIRPSTTTDPGSPPHGPRTAATWPRCCTTSTRPMSIPAAARPGPTWPAGTTRSRRPPRRMGGAASSGSLRRSSWPAPRSGRRSTRVGIGASSTRPTSSLPGRVQPRRGRALALLPRLDHGLDPSRQRPGGGCLPVPQRRSRRSGALAGLDRHRLRCSLPGPVSGPPPEPGHLPPGRTVPGAGRRRGPPPGLGRLDRRVHGQGG
jgi:hypothetical protein